MSDIGGLYSSLCDLSVGESYSTLGASSLKNLSAVSGCHSFSEAMLLFSLSLLGLICSFHVAPPLKIF